jgi:hypothetical protein
MATRRVLTRVDDLDGSTDTHTVRSGSDGQEYEIDLTDGHAQRSRDVLCWRPTFSAVRRLTKNGRLFVRIDLDKSTNHQSRAARKPAASRPADT